ncbi:MAG: hypothetical protein QCH35_02990 [Methanomicrobiaceae archaeon]|nr:hypothetical protein [Methanomicrobiaceae archaeon]
MVQAEIDINRRGINSVEVPSRVEISAGDTLVLDIVNHGPPVHLTLSSDNSASFTEFFHENLYLRERQEFRIPLYENAFEGSFDLAVITGYGMHRGTIGVFVSRFVKKQEPVLEVPPVGIPSPEPERSFPVLIVPLLLAAGIMYGAWMVERVDLLNYAAVAALSGAVLVAWLSRR